MTGGVTAGPRGPSHGAGRAWPLPPSRPPAPVPPCLLGPSPLAGPFCSGALRPFVQLAAAWGCCLLGEALPGWPLAGDPLTVTRSGQSPSFQKSFLEAGRTGREVAQVAHRVSPVLVCTLKKQACNPPAASGWWARAPEAKRPPSLRVSCSGCGELGDPLTPRETQCSGARGLRSHASPLDSP